MTAFLCCHEATTAKTFLWQPNYLHLHTVWLSDLILKSLILNGLIAKFSHRASPAPLTATWKDILSPDELEQMPNFDLHLFKAYLQRKYSELIGESPL